MRTIALVFLLAVALIVGCSGKKNFKGKDDQQKAMTKLPEGGEGPTTTSPSGPNKSASSGNNSGDQSDRGNVDIAKGKINCDDKDQEILILDFKSGWWAGDGGQVYKKITKIIKEGACTTEVNVEYHHILKGEHTAMYNDTPFMTPVSKGILGNLKKTQEGGGLENYTQVWILSGSKMDTADISATNSEFKALRVKLLQTSVNMFIGAGQGSVTHANAILNTSGKDISNDLKEKGFSSNIIEPTQPEGRLFFPEKGIKVLSRIDPEDGSHGIFTKVSGLIDAIENKSLLGNLPNNIPASADSNAQSDKIIDSSITIIANSAKNIPCIGITAKGGKRILIDSGMQRLYGAVMPNEPGSLKYLANIVSYLSK